MNKKVLITGASGFIGNFLIDEGLRNNFEIYAAVRKSSNIAHLKNKNLKIVEINLSDKNSLVNTLSDLPDFNYIIHNAGLTKALKREEYFKVNYHCTKNFAEAIRISRKTPEKFFFMSSLAAFGPGKPKTKDLVKLSDKPSPITFYGESKLEADNYITKQSELPYIILRPTAVYGPGEKDLYQVMKLINNHLEFYIGSDNQFLTFIYVKDLVRAVFRLLESTKVNKSYFISDTKLYQKYDLCNFASEALGKKTLKLSFPIPLVKVIAATLEKLTFLNKGKAPILNIDKIKELSATNWNCDILPLVEDIGFVPQYFLKDGLKETIDWYKNEGWL
ncbi:MAG: NAD(P)-dependent oxidoreductase [Bacteroidota bacterium]|nr:NAD(P)-dependent oxidoreductase [Bacteroidota bacterium]